MHITEPSTCGYKYTGASARQINQYYWRNANGIIKIMACHGVRAKGQHLTYRRRMTVVQHKVADEVKSGNRVFHRRMPYGSAATLDTCTQILSGSG